VSIAGHGRQVAGYLAEPRVSGRHGAVVVVHGSGGDRSELLGQAKALAARGLVALTITEPSSTSPAASPTTVAELLAETKARAEADVDAVRDAASYLAALPNVDSAHIGYLGWSAGAKTGALVAASDRRFVALALLSAGADPVSSFVASAPASARRLVRRTLTAIDPIGAIARARPGTILLEDGTQDTIVPRPALQNIVRAAPPRTTVRWYPAGHALSRSAWHQALDWLTERLT
jgi:dienelactone hydrolase